VASFVVNMANKAREAGSKFLQNVVSFIKNLPSNMQKWLRNAVAKVTEFGTNAVAKAKTAAKNIKDAVVNGIKGLPDKIKTVGKDLVKGLWNGINNAKDWLIGKIKSFTNGVLDGIKDFFGVHSPAESRGALKTTDWIGEMLDEGLGNGIADNADIPLDAMDALSDDLLSSADGINGLTLERQINHKYSSTAAAAQVANGLNAKLDQILDAITRGQVILLDGKKLIGGTAEGYDTALGQRRALIEMGAL
jgi:phage-related protein